MREIAFGISAINTRTDDASLVEVDEDGPAAGAGGLSAIMVLEEEEG